MYIYIYIYIYYIYYFCCRCCHRYCCFCCWCYRCLFLCVVIVVANIMFMFSIVVLLCVPYFTVNSVHK